MLISYYIIDLLNYISCVLFQTHGNVPIGVSNRSELNYNLNCSLTGLLRLRSLGSCADFFL